MPDNLIAKEALMRITLVYDNSAYSSDCIADWGFACLIEGSGMPRVLFDTGANGKILLSNIQVLGIDPKSIDLLVISHDHWDHTGGLSDLLHVNNTLTLYVPEHFPDVPLSDNIVRVSGACALSDGIYTTGVLDGIEQSLVFTTGKTNVVIVGCSHPGADKILQVSSQWGMPGALIGGLHGFSRFEVLDGLSLICACHCTQHQSQIQQRFPKTAIPGGAGRIITIQSD